VQVLHLRRAHQQCHEQLPRVFARHQPLHAHLTPPPRVPRLLQHQVPDALRLLCVHDRQRVSPRAAPPLLEQTADQEVNEADHL